MENFLVYIHTTPNGKVYVGLTGREPEVRFGCNGYNYKNRVFYNAIKKYGWDNITHEYMKGCLTKEEACDLEIKLISFYNSNNPKFGYNVTSGGEHGSYKHTEESINKIIKAQEIKVICITTGEIFDSATKAENYYKLGHHVGECCRGKRKSCGSLPNGEKLKWKYYEEGGS